jgi:hypothetical protein
MFKPTKPHHIANKAYVDNNSGGGGGTAEGIVVEFDFYENPETVYDKRLISKTKIANALAAFKAGGVVVFHIPHVEGGWCDEAYAVINYCFPNAIYYERGAGGEKETERLYPGYKSSDATGESIGNLTFSDGYVDDSGYYNIPIYVD